MNDLQEFFYGQGVMSMEELVREKGKQKAEYLYAEFLMDQSGHLA